MQPDPTPEAPPGTDVSVSMERANVVGGLLLPAAAGAVLLPFWLLWGWDALRAGIAGVFATWLFLPVFAALVVAHEALHGVGFLLFGRAPRGALHFGIDRGTLSPFAGCRAPLSAAAYRGALLLPALLLGVVPAVAGWATGNGVLAVAGAGMIAAAGGDLLVLWIIRDVPARARVVDHPSRVGCVVVEEVAVG